MKFPMLRMRRLRAVHWFGTVAGVLVLVVIAGVVGGLLALGRLADNRRLLVDRLDPAVTGALHLSNALLNEQSAVSGFALTADPAFLELYRRGRAEERRATRDLVRLTRAVAPGLRRDAAAVRATADAWRAGFAEPVTDDRRAGGQVARDSRTRGKILFDAVRASLARLQGTLRSQREQARAELGSAAATTRTILLASGVVLLLSVLAATAVLRRVLVAPMGRLARQVREVARGDFGRAVTADGAREVVMLGEDVDAMRTRILKERDELQRSNAELEQFAYVASHDLQEPLRKVASFTQMLQRRYQGRLDERADTYMAFAVDGAKRMQDLINDLLAFSRVGRLKRAQVAVDCQQLVARALASLSELIDETDAVVEVAELPRVRGEASLLALVFQNLMANGLKFRRDGEPPRITVDARRDGEWWRFTVADNGIGIESEYADRIFIIFQRLHPRSAYEGTGIGLAMCRKVVEYHGGRIWLDTEREGGAAFQFTLPADDDSPEDQAQP